MQSQSAISAFQKDPIESIDFSMVINKLVKSQGWTRKQAYDACQQYKNFLRLYKKYGEKYSLPPSQDIDEFWHNHILDTKKYHHDCDLIFGRYLHHYPYLGMDNKTTHEGVASLFDMTQKLYFEEFGDYIYEIRPRGLRKLISWPIQLLNVFFTRLKFFIFHKMLILRYKN